MQYYCVRYWLALAVVLVTALTASAFPSTAPSEAISPTTIPSSAISPTVVGSKAAIVVLRGEVDDFERDSIERRFAEARAAGADTVIVQINTYGGLVTAGLEISGFIKRQTDLHTIAFVDEKAISAGAMIAMACNEIVMDPSAVIGDCAPIIFKSDGGIDSMGAAERAKAQSPVLADFLDSARRNNHDPLLAESMVAVDHVVHYIESPSGERRFVNETDYQSLSPKGWKPVSGIPDPINRADELLTVHTDIALKIGLARTQATSPVSLADERHLKVVGTFAPGAGEKFVELLNNPFARMLLIIVFMASLKIGLSAPGHGAAEAIALISLGLLVGMPLLTGYALWWEVLLIFAGVALIAFEVFVFPGHFVSAVTGVLLLLVGLVLTFVGSEPAGPGVLPQLPQTWDMIERGLIFVAAGMAGSLALWIWLNRFLPSIPYFNRLVLTATSGGATPLSGAASDIPAAPEPCWPPVGSVGLAVTDLRPGGSASFADGVLGDTRLVAVVSDSGYVAAGAAVQVRESRGNRVLIRAAPAVAQTPGVPYHGELA